MIRIVAFAAASCLALAGAGCGGGATCSTGGVPCGAGGQAAGGAGGSGGSGGPVATSYYRDVEPIIAARCQGCHVAGGVAPFSLEGYDRVAALAGTILDAIRVEYMPPWLPAQDCMALQHERRVTAPELDLLTRWEAEGRPLGDPADAPPPLATKLVLPAVDLSLDIGGEYAPNAARTDDYRCFVAEPGLTADADLLGVEVTPGDRRIVHHVLLFHVPPDGVEALRIRDAADPGLGFPCGGFNAQNELVGWWVPGEGAVVFPEPTGPRLLAGGLLMFQIHYNTLTTKDGRDRTRVEFDFAPAPVAKPARIVGLAQRQFLLPAGDPETVVTAELPVLQAATLWGVAPHMHLLGRQIRVDVTRPGQAAACAVDIPRWDFNYQQLYFFKQPVRLPAGSRVKLTCVYDNSADSQPLVDGRPQPPRDVTWGEGTLDEMCLNYLYYTRD